MGNAELSTQSPVTSRWIDGGGRRGPDRAATPRCSQDGTPLPKSKPIDHALPLKQPGKLIVHADQPLYEPWFIDNDPSNGKGFERSSTPGGTATSSRRKS
ncbi:MAG: hypothetical protein U0075_10130 [Thermomicrobiales bacterium]